MVALGAALRGAASRAFGGQGRGGGPGYRPALRAASASGGGAGSVIDRGVISGAYGGTGAELSSGAGLASRRAPVILNVGLLNPADPSSQRVLYDAMNAGADRGLALTGA